MRLPSKKMLMLIPLILFLALGAGWYFWPSQEQLAASGGEYFEDPLVLNAPLFLQNDPRWAEDGIGDSGSRMGAEGCAVASVAMLLNYYGVKADPKALNRYLSQNGGYTEQGWIYWNKACGLSDGQVIFAYAGSGSYALIDENLKNNNPVIVKVLIGGSIPHWVLVVGKEGREYLINDPLAQDGRPSKLSKYNSNIYAVRVYKKAE